ncbi:MAG: PEP-CTERM sorting domain-containing protein [Phycisphaerae bacterium]
MKTQSFFLIVCGLLVALMMSGTAQASSTWAYAAISKDGHTPANNSDSDTAPGYCTSTATAACPFTNDASQASTTATVWYTTGHGPLNIYNSSIVNNNLDAATYQPHSFSNSGSCSGAWANAQLIGQGVTVQAKLLLQSLSFSIPVGVATDSRTISMNLGVNSSQVYAGSFTLAGNGSKSGSGIYADSFFDVVDSGSGKWVATYNGPAERLFDVPVNTDFSMDLYAEGAGIATAGTSAYDLAISIPQGYEFVPEPATLSLLVIGGLLLGRKRRA